MKCRDCIFLRGLHCSILGKNVHSGLGPKCKYYTVTELERAIKSNRREHPCTGSTEKKTARK